MSMLGFNLDIYPPPDTDVLFMSSKLRHQSSTLSQDGFIMPTLEAASVTEWSDMSETLSSVSDTSSVLTNRTMEGPAIDNTGVNTVGRSPPVVHSRPTRRIDPLTASAIVSEAAASSVLATSLPGASSTLSGRDDRQLDRLFRLGMDNVDLSRDVQYHLQRAVETAVRFFLDSLKINHEQISV